MTKCLKKMCPTFKSAFWGSTSLKPKLVGLTQKSTNIHEYPIVHCSVVLKFHMFFCKHPTQIQQTNTMVCFFFPTGRLGPFGHRTLLLEPPFVWDPWDVKGFSPRVTAEGPQNGPWSFMCSETALEKNYGPTFLVSIWVFP